MLNKLILHGRLITRRIFLLIIGKLFLVFILFGRMFYIQILKNNEYTTLSDKNRINLILKYPRRGKIYDIKNKLLADNRPCFRIFLNKLSTIDYYKQVKLICDILSFSNEEIEIIYKNIRNSRKYLPVMIANNLSFEQISCVEEHKFNLSAIFVDIGFIRFYPFDDMTSNIIGYIGIINEREKQELQINNISEFNIGKSSIEKYYENKLRGEFGYQQVEINAYGQQLREINNIPPVQGEDIYLNIDSSLQQKTIEYLSNVPSASAILMDITSGAVIVLASTPSYKSNQFNKLSKEYWQDLNNNIYRPLINKTIQTSYPPGSIFKLITIIAALESGISPNKIINCTGASVIGTNSFRCHKHYGHGNIDMTTSLQYSCNSYMYEIAKIIGGEKIIDVAKKFGFGVKTGIDLCGEISGFLPSNEWKLKIFKSGWTIGDSMNIAIGQGALLSTPIQIANFVTSIANNGKLFIPTILKKTTKFQTIDVKQENLDFIKRAMYKVVNNSGGTAYGSKIDNYIIAGKTGTAQVQAKTSAKDDLNRTTIEWKRRNHASFIGFAPYHSPRYAVSVIVDHGGGGGSTAAPIATKILQECLQYEK